MGLRESHKTRLRARILESGIALFRERGYGSTRVSEIAARAEVSPATIFNHFEAKDALLGAWLDGLVERAFEAAGAESSAAGARRQIREFVRKLAPEVAQDPDLARLAARRARSGTELGPPRPRAAVQLFRAAQARGELRADLPAEQLAELAAGAVRTALCGWLSGEDEAGPLAPRLVAVMDLLLDGCQKRHERVSAPLPRRSPPGAHPG